MHLHDLHKPLPREVRISEMQARVLDRLPIPYSLEELIDTVGYSISQAYARPTSIAWGRATFALAIKKGYKGKEARWIREVIRAYRRWEDVDLDSHVQDGPDDGLGL